MKATQWSCKATACLRPRFALFGGRDARQFIPVTQHQIAQTAKNDAALCARVFSKQSVTSAGLIAMASSSPLKELVAGQRRLTFQNRHSAADPVQVAKWLPDLS